MRVYNRHAADVASVPAQSWGQATPEVLARYPWALSTEAPGIVPLVVSRPVPEPPKAKTGPKPKAPSP